MQKNYVTVDVFTDRIFGGNPLAVVLDAAGLSSAQMQSIATEFNYSETTFVLPARERGHSAQVRIFTSHTEVPFAGHPNVGTAVVLARELEARGQPRAERLLFEEEAGLVSIELLRDESSVIGAELTAPQPLSIGASASQEDVAAALSLSPREISLENHPPQVISVGLAFLVAELVSGDALRRAIPDLTTHRRVLPPIGTDAIFAYVRGSTAADLQARMFAPLDGTVEDPATGSATAATIALLTSLRAEHNLELRWRVEQGVDMGRPSLLLGRTARRNGRVEEVRVAGHAVEVMRGVIQVPPK